MKPLFVAVLLVCLSPMAKCQLTDLFTDGNYTSNPVWEGDDSLFLVNDELQLQSNASIAKAISLTTKIDSGVNEWRFWCRFAFSPSTSNLMRVYLVSDTSVLTGAVNGYYVQLGGVTGSSDSILLCKQQGNIHTKIIGGRPATVSKIDNRVRVKVVYQESVGWRLFTDTLGGFQYELEGTAQATEKWKGLYFGVYAKFTSSNTNRFYWDDIYAGPKQVDTIPPKLQSIEVLSNTQLRLVFSEPILQNVARETQYYLVSQQVGEPQSVLFNVEKQNEVILQYAIPLANGSYVLDVLSVFDTEGNQSMAIQRPFVVSVFKPFKHAVLITEFFPDPSPAIDLPEAEFIELYNNSNSTIQLEGWSITDGTTKGFLPPFLLQPDSLIIVCSSLNKELFGGKPSIIGVSSWPSLNNSADMIELRDPTGLIIHQLQYDVSWYGDLEKAEGGFTIELDNPLQLCKGKLNYKASHAVAGGTPGEHNSRWNKRLDEEKPNLLYARALSETELELVFTEPMDSQSLVGCSLHLAPSNNIHLKTVQGRDTLLVTLAFALQPNLEYTFTIQGAADCSLNRIDSLHTHNFVWQVFDTAQTYDVLITEVMSDPEPAVGLPVVEYIELYNRSNRIISLDNWSIESEGKHCKLVNLQMRPNEFLVLVPATQTSLYFDTLASAHYINSFPILSNAGKELMLLNNEGKMIHAIHYENLWHTSSEKMLGGWSLEMVDVENPCGGATNWASSKGLNGGTPGAINSVVSINPDAIPPSLKRVYPIDETHLELHFSESIDSISFTKYSIALSDLPTQAVSIGFGNALHTHCIVELSSRLISKQMYTVQIESMKDCALNEGKQMSLPFGLPEQANSGDWLINELLFNPRPGANDFVEILNRSDKVLDAKELWISNGDATTNLQIIPTGWMVLPKQYLVITPSLPILNSNYRVANPENVITSELPSFNDDEGSCIVRNNRQEVLDAFEYSKNMHFALLTNEEGISLERIDPNRPSSDATNWISASSTSGYATPTAINSQFSQATIGGLFSVTPELFSPDGDGYQDVAHFSYQMKTAGYTANLNIYNSSGQGVRQLLRNQLFGTEGIFSWDGMADNGTIVPMGIYVCVLEVFTLQGESKLYKQVLAVGKKQ